LNVIEGKYPEKPRPRVGFSHNSEDVVFIPGNEGLAVIEAVGPREPKLRVGDWVVMHRAQSGMWAQRQVVDRGDVIALDEEARRVGREGASMLMVSR
jgi:trans-2-enoyl-CoA reductase